MAIEGERREQEFVLVRDILFIRLEVLTGGCCKIKSKVWAGCILKSGRYVRMCRLLPGPMAQLHGKVTLTPAVFTYIQGLPWYTIPTDKSTYV